MAIAVTEGVATAKWRKKNSLRLSPTAKSTSLKREANEQ